MSRLSVSIALLPRVRAGHAPWRAPGARDDSSLSALAAETSGGVLLARAVVKQAVVDLQARQAPVRDAAERFWRSAADVRFWSALLALDPVRLAWAVLRETQ